MPSAADGLTGLAPSMIGDDGGAAAPTGDGGLPTTDASNVGSGGDGGDAPSPLPDGSTGSEGGATDGGGLDGSSDPDGGDDVDAGDAVADSGAADGGSDSGEDEDPQDEDEGNGLDGALCHLEPSQVLVLGDSYVALDPSFVLLDQHPFTSNLEALAREAGALGDGEEYRDHALSGASMAYLPSIPQQLEDAIAGDDDIKLVIMTGGGNDILVNNRQCLEYETRAELVQDETCVQVVQDAIDEGQAMFDRGVEVGARAVVYFFYPRLPGAEGGGIGAGTYPNVVLDYAYPKVRDLCDRQTAAKCFFVDMRGPFDEDGDGASDDGLINIDGIHPTYAGSELLASQVWKVMKRECLASQ